METKVCNIEFRGSPRTIALSIGTLLSPGATVRIVEVLLEIVEFVALLLTAHFQRVAKVSK